MYMLSSQQKFSNCSNLFDNLLNPPLGILSLSVGQSSIPLRLYKHVRLEQHTLRTFSWGNWMKKLKQNWKIEE